MAYNLLGQQGPKGSRNPDPNLTDEQATYLYDNPPGQGDNKGVTGTGEPVDKADVQEKLGEVETVEDEVVEEEDETTTPTGRDDVRKAQTLLKNAGFDPGPIDGLIGPLTRGAATKYIDASKGQEELNKRRKEVGFIIGLKVEDTTPTDDDGELEETEEGVILYDADGNKRLVDPSIVDELLNLQPPKFFRKPPSGTTVEGGKTFNELLEGIEFGPSISADATSYEVDKINEELGFTDTAFGSALNRAENRINEGLYTTEEYNELIKSIGTAWIGMMNADKSLAARLGSFVNLAATAAGVTSKAVGVAMEEVFGSGLNALYDIVEPDVGGAADAFIDAALGKPGENVFSDWWIDKYGTYRYDAFTNSMVDVSTGETVASIGNAQGDEETKKNNEENIPTAPGGNGGTGAVDEGPLYWGRYDTGSWATSTLEGKPEGFTWGWDLPEFADKSQEDFISDNSIESILSSLTPQQTETVDYTVTIYKGNQVKVVDYRDLQTWLDQDWSTTEPEQEEIVAGEEEVVEDEVGPGQLVSDTLNEFNNVPQNSILIEAGGQLFLGYEVPGAYGQMYNGNPIFMLYEVLNNDVFEAGLLTQGANPQINVSLGSLEDLNQYGIIVGGTDELTDDVEHPFIRFTENFEAGKRVNPWLNDTAINPLSGVTYQQEAIEFLAEQALEQWTPEQTQVRYEGSDWYRKSTTAQKTWLTTLLTQPAQAQQDIQDKQIEVKAAMEANGISSPPDALVAWVADKAVTGMWTQVYTDQQIALLADPYKPGARDTGMVNFIEGVGVGTLDRLSVGEKTVRDLYRRYLGPSLGNASDTEIAEKAGLLRSDPDAEEQLKSYLEQQRLAMFGNYTNPTLTYNDIVQPYKNLVNQVWGQEVDETQDWFIKMVQDNDIEKAYTTLRQKGMEQGIERVQDQALNDLQRGIGQGQVAPELGANR